MKNTKYIPKSAFHTIFSLIFLFSTIASATQETTTLLNSKKVTINGVKISDDENTIIRILGKPIKSTVGFSEVIAKNTKYLYYKGIIIYLTKYDILNLSCNQNCITDQRIIIGSTREEVFNAYGINNKNKNKASYTFSVSEEHMESSLEFHFKNSVVYKIEYWVNYT